MEDIEKKFAERRKYVLSLCTENIFEDFDKESKKYLALHSKMVVALALVHKASLYEHTLFKKINTHPELKGEKRLSKTLDAVHSIRGEKLYMDIYNLCWRTAKKYIDKNGCFTTRIY